MAQGRSRMRLCFLSSTMIVISHFGSAQAQVLLDQIPDPNLGFGADYLRRGSGYGSVPDTFSEQQTIVGTTVLNRAHPEYDALGIQYGKLRFDANGSESLGYDSNPLGLTNAKSSPFNETQAEVSGSGVWDNYGATARLSFDNFRYWNISPLNHTDYTGYLGGYYDIGRDRLQGSYTHLSLNLLPTGIDNFGTNRVTPFTDDEFRISYTTQFGRITVIPDASYSMFRFSNTAVGTVGGSLGDFSSQTNDRDVGELGMTLKYELSPGKDVVAIGRGASADFKQTAIGGLNQNYTDYQALAGVDIQTQGKFRYRLLGGYELRQFKASQLGSQSSPVFEGQVIWVPTQLTTVTLTTSRQIENVVNAGLSSFKYTTARLQADHEVRRNIIVSGFGQIQYGQYQQNVTATVYNVGLKATYHINRHLAVVLSDEYIKRSSNNDSQINRYNDNILLLTLRVSL